ncbi:predicted protein [Histoplasma capsulatum H143]|uniref:Uncharacterized protein n=1 Tax=Ajellomyces capsulatus (strain H143) TaxID=544712 RepID=C6H9M9_AJECH|nr:predicted protein [Histoplasma capsulatum H143]
MQEWCEASKSEYYHSGFADLERAASKADAHDCFIDCNGYPLVEAVDIILIYPGRTDYYIYSSSIDINHTHLPPQGIAAATVEQVSGREGASDAIPPHPGPRWHHRCENPLVGKSKLIARGLLLVPCSLPGVSWERGAMPPKRTSSETGPGHQNHIAGKKGETTAEPPVIVPDIAPIIPFHATEFIVTPDQERMTRLLTRKELLFLASRILQAMGWYMNCRKREKHFRYLLPNYQRSGDDVVLSWDVRVMDQMENTDGGPDTRNRNILTAPAYTPPSTMMLQRCKGGSGAVYYFSELCSFLHSIRDMMPIHSYSSIAFEEKKKKKKNKY